MGCSRGFAAWIAAAVALSTGAWCALAPCSALADTPTDVCDGSDDGCNGKYEYIGVLIKSTSGDLVTNSREHSGICSTFERLVHDMNWFTAAAKCLSNTGVSAIAGVPHEIPDPDDSCPIGTLGQFRAHMKYLRSQCKKITHIIFDGHGSPGGFFLGTDRINGGNASSYFGGLSCLFASGHNASPSPAIYFFSCQSGGGCNGRRFMEAVGSAAFPTGTGHVEAPVVQQASIWVGQGSSDVNSKALLGYDIYLKSHAYRKIDFENGSVTSDNNGSLPSYPQRNAGCGSSTGGDAGAGAATSDH